MGSEVKFNIFLRLLTNENIIFMSKIVRQWLRNCAPFNSYFKGFLTKPSKIPYY